MYEKLSNHLLQFIKAGESITVEFKEARKKLPSNLFETICSMLNRNSEKYITSTKLKNILLEFIINSKGRTRQEINEYIYPLLNEELSLMNNRVRTSLTHLKKKGIIENLGSDTKSIWRAK